MPQTTAENKFFQDRADKFWQNRAAGIDKVHTVIEFQELQKNITGGAE